MSLHKTVAIGDRIPDFQLLDQHGKWIRRGDFQGKPLVIFFYPKDHTPGCTAEACSFRDYESEFQEAGAQVIGINDAEVSMHKSFAIRYDLKYPLLSDPGQLVRKSFGASGLLFNTVANRITYVTDGSHKVAYIFQSLFRANHHVYESLDFIKKMAHDTH